MWSRLLSSRQRYQQYKEQIKRRGSDASRTSTIAPDTELGQEQGRYVLQRSFFNLFGEFVNLLRGHRTVLTAALVSLSVATIVGLIPLYGMKLVIDSVLADHPLPGKLQSVLDLLNISIPDSKTTMLTMITGGMVLLSISSLILNMTGRWQATRITKRLQASVRRKAFEHAVRLPLHRVYELKSGGAASLLRDDAGNVGELIFAMIYNPCRAIIQLTGSLVILAFTDWRLLLGSLAILPAVWITHKAWIGRIRPLYKDIRATRQYTDAHATESFGGMRVVRSFARQRTEAAQFSRNTHLMARQELLAWWWARSVNIAWSIMIPLASAGVLWYGGREILADAQRVAAGTLAPDAAMTVGDLVLFLTYLGWLLGPLEALANSATQLQNGLAALDRVVNLFDEPTEMPDRPNALRVERDAVAGAMTLRDVSYAYPNTDHDVIQNINLKVEPGEMIALVGPSGAGKTTFCNLIARFYDPTHGVIELDGIDLRDIGLESYRRLLGVVEQDTFLFDGTIADNIGYGQRSAPRDQVIHAARLANAHNFIELLPQGYDTRVGERGVKLSGGQRQRLTIARAILADPRILILDEATSNLDTESERLIQSSLHALMEGRTSFVIAHRLSTIMHADRIVVLVDGRIVEQGTHDELMRRSGQYRQMVEMQTQPPPPPRRERRDSNAPSPQAESY